MSTVADDKLPLDTALRTEHDRLGACFAEYFCTHLPERYDAIETEYRFGREAVALIDTGYQAIARLDGPDRVRYLNAVLTSNIRDLKPGEGALGLLLDSRGHILSELYSYACEDHLLTVSPAMVRARTHATLEQFIIMDDATLTDLTERVATLAIEGPCAPELLRELAGIDLAAMAEHDHREASLGGTACRIARRMHFGEPGAELFVACENVQPLWQLLVAAARKHGGGPIGYAALNALRVEAGIPWFGADFDASVIPHEAGIEKSHISYTKGCYTGQEIVERVRSRGQVNRLRVGLAFPAGTLLAPATKLLHNGKEIGYVTSAAHSPALGRGIGMGYVRREHSSAGTALTWEGGSAEVITLPVVRPTAAAV